MQPKLDVPVAWGHPLGEISPNMTVTTNKGVCDRLACCTFFFTYAYYVWLGTIGICRFFWRSKIHFRVPGLGERCLIEGKHLLHTVFLFHSSADTQSSALVVDVYVEVENGLNNKNMYSRKRCQ